MKFNSLLQLELSTVVIPAVIWFSWTLTMGTIITEATVENAIVNQQTCLKPFNAVTRDAGKQISRC